MGWRRGRSDIPQVGAPLGLRWRAMARLAVRMLLHDRLKSLGTLLGVVFAVVLSNQQIGTFLGLVHKNVMFVENAGADLWIAPAGTETLEPGRRVSDAALSQARTTPGVAWAEPLLFGAASLRVPATGGSEPVTLVGTRLPRGAGGPWNLVAGDVAQLAFPGAVVFEHGEREAMGELALGDERELNGRTVRAAGFTWGLVPFGPSYAFADYELARELLGAPRDQTDFVLVGLAPGADIEAVRGQLAERVPEALVFTRASFRDAIVSHLLTSTAIGITFGTSTVFALLIGFVIVSLSMFSAVVDQVREFGTLKAIGATMSDLRRALTVQSVAFALTGTLIGLALVTRVAEGIRSPQLAVILPPPLFAATAALMVLLCLVASGLALARLRKVEPGMVFR